MDGDRPLEPTESQTLAAEAARGRRADRDLARRLDRPAPGARDADARDVDALAGPGAPREETAMVEAAKAGDERALAQLVHAHLPRVAAMSRRYTISPRVERLELVQEGVAALLRALDRFDPSRGTPLWGYARPAVQRAMQRVVAELDDAATLSDHALRRLSRLRSAEDELMREHRRMPAVAEIVDRSGVDRDEAERVLAAARPARSLQEPITAEDGGVIGSLGDLVDDPRAQDAYERVLDVIEAQELMPLLSVLSPRERQILRARSGLEGEARSRREIAERLGLSVSRVRDIEQRALAKLRSAARASLAPEALRFI
jgi:RNA polymerase primary sigma factor